MNAKKKRIYTRSGDDGTTSLLSGQRVKKDNQRLKACGSIDELNCVMGWLRSCTAKEVIPVISKWLFRIQNELFELGAILANPNPSNAKSRHLSTGQILKLEAWIDTLEKELPALSCFVLPGGNESNTVSHLARAVCRRAEREVITLSRKEKLPALVIPYLNRLSDLLFVMARYACYSKGIEEFRWKGK